jgi:hypothetical protein
MLPGEFLIFSSSVPDGEPFRQCEPGARSGRGSPQPKTWENRQKTLAHSILRAIQSPNVEAFYAANMPARPQHDFAAWIYQEISKDTHG